PITVSERAIAAIEARKQPVQSWYLDLIALQRYWAAPHAYHHTSGVSLIYALHTALRLALDEGLTARHTRHQLHGRAVRAGITALGLNLFAAEQHQLPMLTAVRLPENVEAAALRRALLDEDGIEIGGGLGDTARSLVRIGIMGYNAQRRNVVHMLAALERLL